MPSISFAKTKPREFDLKNAMSFALDASKDLRTQKINLQIKEFELTTARSMLLPQVDILSSLGVQRNENSATTSYSSETKIQATQTIYDNGASLTRYESVQKSIEGAKLTVKLTRDKILYSVLQELVNHSILILQHRNLIAQKERLIKHGGAIERLYKDGLRPRRDLLKSESEIGRSIIEIQGLKIRIDRSRLEFLKLIGITDSTQLQTDKISPIDTEDLDKLNLSKLKTNEISANTLATASSIYKTQKRIYDQEREVLESEMNLLKRQKWPEINWTLGAASGTTDYWQTQYKFGEIKSNQIYSTLGLKWNLLDWGSREAAIRSAAARIQLSEITNQSELQTIQTDYDGQLKELELAKEILALNKKSLDNEQKSFEIFEKDFRMGKASNQEFLNASRDLMTIRDSWVSAYFDFLLRVAKMKYYNGEIYEFVQSL